MKLIFYFLFFCLYIFNIQALDVRNILDKINSKDKRELEALFKYFIYNDHFGYTILNDKAISLSGDFTLTPWQNTLCGCKSGGCFWNKWNVWKKYCSLFPMERFIILEEQSYNFPGIKFIIFINKKKFLEIVTSNQPIFEEILGHKVIPEKLLKEIESGNSSFQAAIKNSEILWGILLGYGEHNARLYSRRDEISRFIGQTKLMLKRPMPSAEFQTIETEEEYLWAQLQSFNDNDDLLSPIAPVNFAADLSHPETKLLEKKYKDGTKEVYSNYFNTNILEKVLIQLTSY